MEDEGFIDDDLIADVARDYVGRYGFDALRVIEERARIAADSGDFLSAQAWQDIADAAKRILA
jgi:hypothetical protein